MSNVSASDIGVPPGVDLDANRGPYLLWVCVAMIILSTLAVGLRFASRKLAGLPLLFDDWTILIALPCALMPCMLDIYCTKKVGFGKHVLALGASPATDVKEFWFHLWISNILYSVSTMLVKISILLFLRRVFRFGNFRIYVMTIGGLVLFWAFATVLTTIFSCRPIQGIWDQSIPHTCINNFDFALGMNIPNIVFDVALMALPLGWLWRIHNSLSQKIALGVVYALAGFVVAVGALRLQSMVEYGPSTDFTWDFIPIGILTALETNSALICACLPAMSPILHFCLHGTFNPIPRIQSSAKYEMQNIWPGQQRDLSEEEAAKLARITGGEAPRNYYHRGTTSISSEDAGCCVSGEKVAKKKSRKKDQGRDVEDGVILPGLEPPRRIKKGWVTPKESRFSDW